MVRTRRASCAAAGSRGVCEAGPSHEGSLRGVAVMPHGESQLPRAVLTGLTPFLATLAAFFAHLLASGFAFFSADRA